MRAPCAGSGPLAVRFCASGEGGEEVETKFFVPSARARAALGRRCAAPLWNPSVPAVPCAARERHFKGKAPAYPRGEAGEPGLLSANGNEGTDLGPFVAVFIMPLLFVETILGVLSNRTN